MDDILKRMLAVEAEADTIVSEAQAKADDILEEARRKANTLTQEAQASLAQEIEQLVSDRVQQAQTTKGEKLTAENRRADDAMKDFQAELAPALPGLTDALLFGAE